MLVKDALSERAEIVVIVQPDDTVTGVAKSLRDKRKGLAVVCDGQGAPLGLISVIDISRAVAEQGDAAPQMAARSAMNTAFVSSRMDDKVDHALEVMAEHNIRHLPVLDEGKLAAVVSMRDLLQARQKEAEISMEEMRRYVLGHGYS